MKFRFSVAFAITVCFALCACEKDSNNHPGPSASYIKAKLNGQEVMFSSNVHVFQSSLPSQNLYSLVIAGDSEVETFDIEIFSPTEFKSGGTYGNLISGTELSEARYQPDFSSTDSSTFFYSHYKYSAVQEKFECKITEITPNYYRGTFTTDLYQDKFLATPQNAKIAVTEGEFWINR